MRGIMHALTWNCKSAATASPSPVTTATFVLSAGLTYFAEKTSHARLPCQAHYSAALVQAMSADEWTAHIKLFNFLMEKTAFSVDRCRILEFREFLIDSENL